MNKVWLITGCSEGGIGAGIAKAVLKNGYQAVITARNTKKIENLVAGYEDRALPLALDVTKPESVQDAVEKAIERFGKIDVLVNNAGYCYRSSVEEAEEDSVMQMYQTNFFGAVRMIQAVLPHMRKQKSGAIINVSSIGAVRTGAASGYYASTKAALELMSEGLYAELRPLGIKTMIVEPGAFHTHFYDSSLKGSENRIADYSDTAWLRSVAQSKNPGNQPGDPDKVGKVLIEAIESGETPLRLLLGSDAVDAVRNALENRLAEVNKWEHLSIKTDYAAGC